MKVRRNSAVPFAVSFGCARCSSADVFSDGQHYTCPCGCAGDFILVKCRACGAVHNLMYGLRDESHDDVVVDLESRVTAPGGSRVS